MAIYTESSISGYNSNPPEDDGSEVSSNEITWDKHKGKLADPIKTLAESINTNVAAAFRKVLLNSSSTITVDTTIDETFHGKFLLTTNEITISLAAAATLGDGWNCTIMNTDGNAVTIDPNGDEIINGVETLTMPNAYDCMTIICDGSEFYAKGFNANLSVIATVESTEVGRNMLGAEDSAAQTALLDNVVGDTGDEAGTAGLVPAPAAGDADAEKYLDAGGEWSRPPIRCEFLTTSGTYTVPDGVTGIKVTLVGGGQGGGFGSLSSGGESGSMGSKGGSTYKFMEVTPGDTIDYTVGSGGAGGIWNSDLPEDGGTTSFGEDFYATGGSDSGIGEGFGGDINLIGGEFSKPLTALTSPGEGQNGNLYGGGGQAGYYKYDGGDGAQGVILVEY